mmetsp:Transcript_37830/g.42190  ORF Transcript_37830/g.42190 Transcript_37830/m.42190 type:complete len:1110 (-) Transcript_37830:2301-5630(-)
MSLHVSSSIDDDGWWDKFVKNDDDYNNGSSFGNLRKFHDVCSFDFFNENENMSKGRFFQVCCFTWMQDFLRIIDGDSLNPKVTPKMLWKILKHIYISGCKEKSGIIKWILPDPSVMSVLKLTNHNNRYSDQNIDMEYTDVLMEFWRELFQFCEDGSSVSLTHESAVDDTSKRPSKRRRLGLHRSRSVVGFTSLLKGQYKLPAVYLLVSLLKETGVASDWDRLCELSHKFPTIYKTFSENDIRAGLALVGLAGISTGKPITGLSTSVLFTTYLSRIDSYGLSILSILHDATALDLYNLRASICQQILDPMNYFDWSEEYKSEIIDACAGCIDQEHPTRFVDDIQNKKQLQLHGKRRRRKIKSVDNPSVPKEVMSPGFPLIVHIQIWLLQHHVEHAAELTRKMDSSSCLDDEVKDKAWFEIWNYLLAEGRLFLDGNIETPEYLKKRDFMYTFMACQVSQKAKLVMMDFFENVANLVFDQEDASIKEKQYVLLACQQTVLRLLLKIRGLGSDTILEFVEKTQWPIEIDGHNAATDLNEWCADFLRERRNIPSTLIDETTGLIDLHGRYELEPKNVVEKDKFDSFLLPESPSVSIGFATENAETEQTLYQEEVATKMLETKDVHQEETSDQNVAEEVNEEVNEDEDEDDEVVVLDSDDDDNDQEVEVEVLDLDDEDDDNDNDNDNDRCDDDHDDTAFAVLIVTSKQERAEAWQFVWRTILLAVETLIVVGYRYVLNGESSPDFIVAQNPAGFAEDRFTRAFSVTWVYCLYIRDALYPSYLSPDWSGLSIDLITHWKDPRTMAVIALWYFAAQSLWTMICGTDTGSYSVTGNKSTVDSNQQVTTKSSSSSNIDCYLNETTLRQINISIWAFSFSPFLLSSNILVVVGLMKADRVIYLPLFGYCLLEAILIKKLIKGAITMRPAVERRKEQAFWGAHFLLMFQLIVFSGRTHERNIAWSHSLRLWESAYVVNPRSYHTMYNYGYELSLKQRYIEAEAVMRPIGNPRIDGPSNTFVYTMVLYNLRQCDRANVLLDEAFRVIEEMRKEGGPRNTESHLSRTESNLLVSKAHCTDDFKERGRVLYRAVEKDQTNDYAIQLATNFMQRMQKVEELQGGN